MNIIKKVSFIWTLLLGLFSWVIIIIIGMVVHNLLTK